MVESRQRSASLTGFHLMHRFFFGLTGISAKQQEMVKKPSIHAGCRRIRIHQTARFLRRDEKHWPTVKTQCARGFQADFTPKNPQFTPTLEITK